MRRDLKHLARVLSERERLLRDDPGLLVAWLEALEDAFRENAAQLVRVAGKAAPLFLMQLLELRRRASHAERLADVIHALRANLGDEAGVGRPALAGEPAARATLSVLPRTWRPELLAGIPPAFTAAVTPHHAKEQCMKTYSVQRSKTDKSGKKQDSEIGMAIIRDSQKNGVLFLHWLDGEFAVFERSGATGPDRTYNVRKEKPGRDGEKKFFQDVGTLVVHADGKTGQLSLNWLEGDFVVREREAKTSEAKPEGAEQSRREGAGNGRQAA